MCMFACRLNKFLPSLLSPDQHGFCPGRNCCTALLNALACLEHAKATSQTAFVMALDVAKAYDSVDRSRLKIIMDHMGVSDNPFFTLLWQAMQEGEIMVKGHD